MQNSRCKSMAIHLQMTNSMGLILTPSPYPTGALSFFHLPLPGGTCGYTFIPAADSRAPRPCACRRGPPARRTRQRASRPRNRANCTRAGVDGPRTPGKIPRRASKLPDNRDVPDPDADAYCFRQAGQRLAGRPSRGWSARRITGGRSASGTGGIPEGQGQSQEWSQKRWMVMTIANQTPPPGSVTMSD